MTSIEDLTARYNELQDRLRLLKTALGNEQHTVDEVGKELAALEAEMESGKTVVHGAVA